MHIIQTRKDLRALVGQWRNAGETIGVVPTMGALHDGHLALVKALDGKVTRRIVTIFVNPIQFNNAEDFQLYPRGVDADAALLAATGVVDVLYTPSEQEMYPPGFATRVMVSGLDSMLCGGDRPGHFDGVATVVSKLLNQTGAHVAAFGEKDYQQLCIIRRLVSDLDMPVDILPVPTVREADGLALSSRNRRFTPAQRQQAALLPAALSACLAAMQAGQPSASALTDCAATLQAGGFTVHYLDLRAQQTLQPLSQIEPGARLFVAATLGGVRLIDNMPVLTPA
ncbi:MAG: pantoate--beta-alanine ligase [Acetobacter peroxydans]|jgi:pantoate--beta-alanine ligase|nr:pantoate--beta-alanine ligase [Acetobacter peroxydans]